MKFKIINDSTFREIFGIEGVFAIKNVNTHHLQWMIDRAEARYENSFTTDLKEALIREQEGKTLLEVLEIATIDNERRATEDDIDSYELLKILVSQEAVFLYNGTYTDVTSADQIAVWLDVDKTEQMKNAVRIFPEKRNELLALEKKYWEQTIPSIRGQIREFIPQGYALTPMVSYVMVCISTRHQSIAKRLDEITSFSNNQFPAELIITLADSANFTPQLMDEIIGICSRSLIPVHLVDSKQNKIAINRNIGTSVTNGEYIIFIDDDVKLVGPVAEQIVSGFKKRADLGVLSIPSYDPVLSHDPGGSKPRRQNLKLWLDKNTVLVNAIPGMIVGVRKDIALCIPFASFWPNNGEDYFFVEEVHRLGFQSAYIFETGTHIIHEHTSVSLTKNNPLTFPHALINFALLGFLVPDSYPGVRQGAVIYCLSKYFYGKVSHANNAVTLITWNKFSKSVNAFLSGDYQALENWKHSEADGLWMTQKPLEMIAVIQYMSDYREEIISFKTEKFDKRDVARLNNAFINCFRYHLLDSCIEGGI